MARERQVISLRGVSFPMLLDNPRVNSPLAIGLNPQRPPTTGRGKAGDKNPDAGSHHLSLGEDGVNRPPVRHVYRPLRCYGDVMEGRSNGLKCLNLGRSIDHSCKGFQHFWVGISVVRFCIGPVLPQTDCDHI